MALGDGPGGPALVLLCVILFLLLAREKKFQVEAAWPTSKWHHRYEGARKGYKQYKDEYWT
jgi:hypothetical protein